MDILGIEDLLNTDNNLHTIPALPVH
jgi:hypothetical protein